MWTSCRISVGNLNECGAGATQVKQCVHLDRGLFGPEASPGEDRQAEVDGGGIQGVHRAVQIEAERFVGVHRARDVNEHLREVGVDAPVVRLVGIGQRRPRDLAAKAHVIELALHRAQTGFDVAETLAERQLGKGQTKELIEAGKSAHFVIAAVPRHALMELVRRDVIHQLRENGAAGKHAPLSEHRPTRYETGTKPSAEICIRFAPVSGSNCYTKSSRNRLFSITSA